MHSIVNSSDRQNRREEEGSPSRQVLVVGTAVTVLMGLAGALPAAAETAIPPTFATAVVAGSTGGFPDSVAIADLNGDGRPDLVTANSNAGDSNFGNGLVNVLTKDASGPGYTSTIAGSTGPLPYSVAVGDLNGDGRPDLVTANLNSVNVLIKDASGAGYTSTVTGTGSFHYSVVIGDLNGDGRPDLATVNLDTVSVLTKDASGPGYTSSIAGFIGEGVESLAIGDLNGDGRLDLATANEINNSVSVLIKDASGAGYTSTIAGVTGARPLALAIGDLNGDGRPDLATANAADDTVSVLTKDASGAGYTSTIAGSTGLTPTSLVIGDLNGDGRPDLATANANANTVSVLTKDASGAGYTSTSTVVGSNNDRQSSLAIGDLNGDGRPDLATADYFGGKVSVLTNTTGSGAPPTTAPPTTAPPTTAPPTTAPPTTPPTTAPPTTPPTTVPQATSVSLATTALVRWPNQPTLSGTLRDAAGQPLPGRLVNIISKQQSLPGLAAFRPVLSLTTDADGNFRGAIRPTVNAVFQAIYLGGETEATSGSTYTVTKVQVDNPAVTNFPAQPGAVTLNRGVPVPVRGEVAPGNVRNPVVLQWIRSNGQIANLTRAVTPAAGGDFVITRGFDVPGTYRLRVLAVNTPNNVASASRTFVLRVR